MCADLCECQDVHNCKHFREREGVPLQLFEHRRFLAPDYGFEGHEAFCVLVFLDHNRNVKIVTYSYETGLMGEIRDERDVRWWRWPLQEKHDHGCFQNSAYVQNEALWSISKELTIPEHVRVLFKMDIQWYVYTRRYIQRLYALLLSDTSSVFSMLPKDVIRLIIKVWFNHCSCDFDPESSRYFSSLFKALQAECHALY